MPNERPDATLLLRLARLALGGLLAISLPTAQALDPGIKLADYNHEIWTAKSGAPPNITTMAQTADGWLWLGTAAGLYRFDGVRFTRFVDRNGAALPGGGVSTLYAKENGELLVGYLLGGIVAVRGETFRTLARETDIRATFQLAVDVDDSVWAASTSGLLHHSDGRWTSFGKDRGFPGQIADAVVLDPAGRLWASNDGDGLYLLDRQRGRFAAAGLAGDTEDIVPAPDGRLWWSQDGKWQVLPPAPGAPAAAVHPGVTSGASSGLFDREGNHWALHCPTGICRTGRAQLLGVDRFDPETAAAERLDQPWQMSHLTAQWILEDREGNIWVATRAGLERFRHNRLVPAPLPAGESWFQVVGDPKGGALVSSSPRGFTFPAGASDFGKPAVPILFAATPHGGLLAADDHRIVRTLGAASTVIPFPTQPDGKPIRKEPVRLAGNDKEIWIGIPGHGLFHHVDGNWVHASRYGERKRLTSIVTAEDGATWMGFRDSSVAVFRNGALATAVANAGIGAIRLIDAQHGVVLMGESGLAVLGKNGVQAVRAADPELLQAITGHALAPDGSRWLNGRKGAIHVAAKAWDDALAHPGQPLQATLYDTLDGYPGSALPAGAFSSAALGRDGKLWFSTQTGVVSLDPAHTYRNGVAPPVVVEALVAPGAVKDADGGYVLPAGTTRLRVDYTALSYTKPERIRFRYRLEGVDSDWQDGGNRRFASYTGLGPGTYRFRVTAVNEDGVPATQDAVVAVEIAPTTFETTWFRLLCVVLGAALLALAYRWRTRRLAQRLNERFQERLDERERIARALHDTLLQNMQALILRLHAAVKPMDRGSEARGRIDVILDQADTVMAEAREELKGLRARGDGERADIGHALAGFGATLQEQFGAEFKLFIGGAARPLQDVAWQEIYFIGREALFNAYQHAHARKIEVELTYGTGEFGLVVRDDGRGIDDDIQQRGGRDGHWGLPGMKERAAALGGSLEWWSRAGLGTEVIARFPAARVYAQSRKPGLLRRLRALLGRTAA